MNRNLNQHFFQRERFFHPISKYVTSQTQSPLTEEEIDPFEERQCNVTTSIYGKHSLDPSPERSKAAYHCAHALAKGNCQTFQEQLNIGTMALC